ncbi:AraC family transcriptional regulator ligand-binding domain-containing protein [Nocardia vinacea]|uniref:AraC family transcriptional regulator ligand-binding domain-containing protein n=1 Tax=Nocardia vinacea TaxID=96468 RepID=UPI00068723E3|nr:AraC family transcriptional regulator ligand-binding domain-containing protein [Nocardia vinacea]
MPSRSHTTNVGLRPDDDPTLHDARIPPSVITGVLDLGEQREMNTESWFAGSGFTRSQFDLPETRLSLRQTLMILRRALRALPSGPIGVHIGTREVFSQWGLLGFAMRSAGYVAEAVDIGLQLHQASGSLLNYEFEPDTREFAVRIDERTPQPELLPFLCEDTCCSMLVLARSIFGGQVAPTRLEFAYPRMPYSDVYSRFFQCSIRYNAPVTRIYFSTEFLNRPIPTANPAQLAIAIEAARLIADPGGHRPDIVSAVEGVLRQNLRQPLPMALVAERLMISERTLHRRLAEAGLMFGEIRDRVRLQRAKTLLRESSLPVAVVAAEVGFSDSREFRRAYQRWTGQAPSAERGTPSFRGTGMLRRNVFEQFPVQLRHQSDTDTTDSAIRSAVGP